ncbi:MAG: TIGR01440 family protein [Bacillota bacterium]|jgi:uncharacterized protein (TIGR01440 family)|nr:TIGR01440 family protein [Bacillota bacterium]
MDKQLFKNLQKKWQELLIEYFAVARIKKGGLLVVGCSTSEVIGSKIGSDSRQDIGDLLFSVLQELASENKINLAIQCCEHLNRALIIERKVAEKFSYPEVNVKPGLHAGGAFAVAAFENMKDPIAVESVQADGGIDIGDTLIGMHLKPVAVPLRLSMQSVGDAHLTAARTRPKLIGGARATYRDN